MTIKDDQLKYTESTELLQDVISFCPKIAETTQRASSSEIMDPNHAVCFWGVKVMYSDWLDVFPTEGLHVNCTLLCSLRFALGIHPLSLHKGVFRKGGFPSPLRKLCYFKIGWVQNSANRSKMFSLNKLFSINLHSESASRHSLLPNKAICHSKSQSNRATTTFLVKCGGIFHIYMSLTHRSVGGLVPPGLTPMVLTGFNRNL